MAAPTYYHGTYAKPVEQMMDFNKSLWVFGCEMKKIMVK